MRKFILQHNAEGGATGVKVICADEFATTATGGILFIRDNNVIAAFSSYAICSEETAALACEADTQAWIALNSQVIFAS
jgi:hypothetical protein